MRWFATSALILVVAAACSRKVTLETAPPAAVAQVSIKVSNTSTQAISLYVTADGTEFFLKSIPGETTEIVPVPGVKVGTTVKLRAALADGSRSYTRDGVSLTGVYEWKVP